VYHRQVHVPLDNVSCFVFFLWYDNAPFLKAEYLERCLTVHCEDDTKRRHLHDNQTLIRVLSKGLNFCPTPNKINEEQLLEDLDKFARSLRIKEYFLAKERDCPEDGSTDSEDDNEIPIPRYKKKNSWIPESSKNTTLESFIDSVKNDAQTAASTNIPTHNNLTPAEKCIRVITKLPNSKKVCSTRIKAKG